MTTLESKTNGTTERDSTFRLWATDVTESMEAEVTDLQRNALAGAVARTLAQRMQLPTDTPWALRDDRGSFLDEDREIGEQVQSEARVTLTPKTHLG